MEEPGGLQSMGHKESDTTEQEVCLLNQNYNETSLHTNKNGYHPPKKIIKQ